MACSITHAHAQTHTYKPVSTGTLAHIQTHVHTRAPTQARFCAHKEVSAHGRGRADPSSCCGTEWGWWGTWGCASVEVCMLVHVGKVRGLGHMSTRASEGCDALCL